MKNLRNLYIIIPAVIVLTAIVGFFITFPSSPPAAYARIFIDLGVLIALLSACMTLPKTPELRTDEVADAIRDLARGHYDRRLNSQEFEELNPIVQAFNELAGTLADSGDPNINRLRYQYVRKQDPEIAEKTIQHSHHPELGLVEVITRYETALDPQEEKVSMVPTPVFAEHSQVPEAVSMVPEFHSDHLQPALNLSEVPAIQKSEFEELYDHFCDAHREQNKDPIDFEEFKTTIDKAKKDLLAAHQCKGIRFEVVLEGSEIALRPRLIR
ncbi:hypothetical protein FJ364_04215 [Candidatus Dependentiae bacterium]|nr:hypothetical protein [Candidatus Dependentiae bacterium]